MIQLKASSKSENVKQAMKFADIVWESALEVRSMLHIINVVLPKHKTAVLFYEMVRNPCLDSYNDPCYESVRLEKRRWGAPGRWETEEGIEWREPYEPCGPLQIQEALQQIWFEPPSEKLLTAVTGQLNLLRPIDNSDFTEDDEGGIDLNPGVDLFRGCLTRQESVRLFDDKYRDVYVPYTIDSEGNSHRHLSDEIRDKRDIRRCSHCGHPMKDRCANKTCIIFGHYDLFD